MAEVFCSSTRKKRKKAAGASGVPASKSSKVTLLSPSLMLLEVPADTNTSLPVWDALRSQQAGVSWSVNPYSINIQVSPKQEQSMASSQGESSGAGLASTVLQPHMLIQSICQQHGTSSNTPSVLLTFSPNTQSQLSHPQKTPPSPNPVTSLIAPLPLIITQSHTTCQPGTPTKIPPVSTTKLQISPKAPVPPLYHTKSLPDIDICDSFLLNLCHMGKNCKKHHTPYPFHWQLWCIRNHEWVSIKPRSQVLLERIYCNVDQEVIKLKDGLACYSLTFDTMELDNPSRYDGVRRLTNSDCRIKNPFFPSKWKLYWWNNSCWEEYNKDVATHLLKKMSEKEPECSFYIGKQEYMVDFTCMTQTNVTTGFQRQMRCRPVYRSPESMKPYLRTGINFDPVQFVDDPPGENFSVDPLEEFSSWYPPVWCQASEEDYSLLDVPTGTQAYRAIANLFYKSLSESKVDIISIQQVQNRLHWDKYQRHKVFMQKQHCTSKEPLERHLFHGTTREASEDICHNNFDPRLAGTNGTSYGFGSYFSTSASFSHIYSTKWAQDDVCHMFLAKVLVGKVSTGRSHYRRPPALLPSPGKQNRRLYDSCVDNLANPTVFVVFDSCQCYPYYLIKYKDLPHEIEI